MKEGFGLGSMLHRVKGRSQGELKKRKGLIANGWKKGMNQGKYVCEGFSSVDNFFKQ